MHDMREVIPNLYQKRKQNEYIILKSEKRNI